MEKMLYLLVFIAKFFLYGLCSKRFQYKKRNSGRMVILANGPSLKDVLPNIGIDEVFKNSNFTVMNFFALSQYFQRIKPRYYCLSDSMFIRKDGNSDKVKKLFYHLQNNVNWDMYLYVPRRFEKKDFLRYSCLSNPYIHIVCINDITYQSFECFRIWLLKKNLILPYINSVVQLGIYAALNNGFDEVRIYGVEHNMICSLLVNDENQLCYKNEHFYDTAIKIEPIKGEDNNLYKIADYLMVQAVLFQSHDQLSKYAKSLGVKVINCTPFSMIDSYERSEF